MNNPDWQCTEWQPDPFGHERRFVALVQRATWGPTALCLTHDGCAGFQGEKGWIDLPGRGWTMGEVDAEAKRRNPLLWWDK